MIFVFGSNLAGIHGAGAANHAFQHEGAKWGQGIGLAGNSYAIPTKSRALRTLSLKAIKSFVDVFIENAQMDPTVQYNVTRIGCGLAGYKDKDIAPLFKDAPANCHLPTPESDELCTKAWRDF